MVSLSAREGIGSMPTIKTPDHDGYLKKVLGRDERVLLVVRQHWLFFFRHVFLWLLLTAAILIATLGAQLNAPDRPQVSLAALIALFPLLVIWWQYMAWNNQKYVMTNRRVLQVSGVLNKEVLDSLLDQVNDVKTTQSLFGRIFDYGSLEILTASDIQTNNFDHIARPLEFKRALLDAKEEISHPKPAS